MKKNKPRYKKGRVKKALKRVNKQVGGSINVPNTPAQIEQMLMARNAQKKRKDPNTTQAPTPVAAMSYDATKGYKAGQTVDAGGGNLYKAKTDVKAGTAGLGNTARWEKIIPAFQATTPVVPTRAADIPDLYTQYPGLANPPAGMVLNPDYIPTQQPSATNRYFIPKTQQATTNFTSPVNAMQESPAQTTVAELSTDLPSLPDDYDAGPPPSHTFNTTTMSFEKNPQYEANEDDTGIDTDTGTDDTVETPLTVQEKRDKIVEGETGISKPSIVKTAIGDVPSSRIKQLQDISAGLGEGRGDPAQQRYARELLAQYGITAANAVEEIDPLTDVTTQDITPKDVTKTEATVTEGDAPSDVTASTYTGVKADDLATTEAAQGTLSPESTARETRADFTDANRVDTATRARQDEQAALATDTQFKEDQRSQAGQIDFREDVSLSSTKEAEERTRKGITDDTFAEREASQIIDKVGFEAAQRRTVTGEAAKGEAATMVAQVGELPPQISEAIVEDPASVTAAVDNEAVEVQAAIASLPTEALVSSQMETLLAGMDEGVTPTWARPAVAQVESMMARRGLSASTVGRDALFNAIVQTALPLAQSNAQALQQRAAQNLSNEQQANMSASTLDMQRRMANLSNQQTAGTQTAQLAQQMSTLQSQFRQQAVLTTAEQQQQVRVQNLANQQDTAKTQAQLDQQTASQNLGNQQQIELADLQYLNATEKDQMSAVQQQRLAEMQLGADFLAKNAGFKQQMDLANLSAEQQTRLANLSAQNAAEADSLSAAQQTELANLNMRMQTNIQSAKIAESMGIAQLNVDQQRAVTNAASVARIDLTKFTTEQQVELANSKFMQTMTAQDLNNRQQSALQDATTLSQMDIQAADLATKTRISNANNFLQMDVQNLSNRQQAVILDQQLAQQRSLSNQAATNASLQFNASSENQVNQFMANLGSEMEKFNTSQANAMEQFNASEANKIAAINENNSIEAAKANADLAARVASFNNEIEFKRESWNSANAQAVEQANIEWRRKANTVDTAAQNASNQQHSQFTYNLSTQANAAMWQELRDQAQFDFTASQTDLERRIQLINAALGSEKLLTDSKLATQRALIFGLLGDVFSDDD